MGSYSVLKMQYMENVVPRAGKYMDFLRREGIIEWKNYSAGRNSRLYRLTNEGKTKFRTITDMNLVRRIEENRAKIGQRNSKKYPHLNRYIRMVEIDHDSAVNDVEKEYLNTRNQIKHDTSLKASKRKKKLRECEGRRTFCLAEIEKIRCGEIFITVNSTNYRLDSNYTRLPSYLMKHLSIDGKHHLDGACLVNA